MSFRAPFVVMGNSEVGLHVMDADGKQVCTINDSETAERIVHALNVTAAWTIDEAKGVASVLEGGRAMIVVDLERHRKDQEIILQTQESLDVLDRALDRLREVAGTVGVIVLALLFTGCASGRALELAGPAPADALSCALGTAVAAGYAPESGGVADGYVNLLRRRTTTAGDVGKEVAARALSMGILGGGNHVDFDAMQIINAAGAVRVRVWALDSESKTKDPTDEGRSDARAIMERCAS